jgi:hypothetical protein
MARRLLIVALAVVAVAPSSLPAREPASTSSCLAVMLPSVRGVEGSSTEVAGAVRDLFTSYLNGPSLQIVALDARLPATAIDEAKQKQCRYILIATLTQKHGGGGMLGKALSQGAGTAAWYIPGGGTVGTAMARGAAAGGAQAVATMAAGTKAKDEMQLEYRVSTLEGLANAPSKTERAKAQADREDLLTPLVERAATAIVALVGTK